MKFVHVDPTDIEESSEPAEAMWQAYRAHALASMGDMSADLCRDVFKSGMSMALAYFMFALHQEQQGEFEKLMQKLDDELSEKETMN